MVDTDFHCIRKIEKQFALSRKELQSYFYSAQRLKFDGKNKDNCVHSIDRLLMLLDGFNQTGKWFEEMVQNSSNPEYIAFSDDVFSRQFKFISKFQQAIKIYYNDHKLVSQYIKRLQNVDKRQLIGEETMLAIQVFNVFIFHIYEMKIDEYMPKYKANIEQLNTPTILEDNDFIRLDYGEKNEEALNKMYLALRVGYINCSLSEFKMHFEDCIPTSKIQFVGSQANLVNLFFGNDSLKVTGLKIENPFPKQVIIEHFINKYGKDYTQDGLTAQENKIITNPRNFEKMKKLLQELMVI